MSIFILEDNMMQAQNLKQMMEEICASNQIAYDFIEATSKSERIIEQIPFTTRIPIYFLDIEIKNEERKGLEVAQQIRKYDNQGIIVFVTTHSEFAPISYQYMVSALTFIDKGLDYETRYQLFKDCLLHYQSQHDEAANSDDFVLENMRATVRVPFNTIDYFMTAEAHRLALITEDRLINFYGTLKEVEALDERLFRCHQSYLVNRDKMVAYEASQRMLVLKSGKRIPVSRRLVRKVKQLLKGER
ncbi:LytR/AlgR family response regulator transcription factor [Pseudogracilibacillus auburnensis]|uniref:LytTR family two component transcriptional regulator n=1 Tax=Pseudogracilibacillus auburnensis TaxID=1494959 RepID=A0A2V3VXN4_9BACI|nr:LytTR family DNA-binding domain-containing protein [Pseudogracilibacillus auburnensis]PXW84815.1 LytTR family two component transcriptional regulator [Pseudogracilibacillus auburnensis]